MTTLYGCIILLSYQGGLVAISYNWGEPQL